MKRFLLAAIAAAALFGCAAHAAVTVSQTPALPQVPRAWKQQILPADTTVAKTFVTAGANGSIVKSIVCTNTDSAQATPIQLSVLRNTVTYVLGTVNVPLSSGFTTAAAAVNVLTLAQIPGLALDSDGNPYLYLEGANAGATISDVLQIASLNTVNTSKATACLATGADF